MTIKEFWTLPADAKRRMTFADVQAVIDNQLGTASLATIKAVVLDVWRDDTKSRIGRTRAGILTVIRTSLFDLKETCDRNV